MELGRENMAPELEDFQNNFSWIPATPAKPNSTTRQQSCSDGKETDMVDASQLDAEKFSGLKQANHGNWFERGRLLNALPQETQCQAIPASYNLTNSVNINWDFNPLQVNGHTMSNVHGENPYTNNKFLTNNENWVNLSFGDLMDMADAGTPAAAENTVTRADSVVACSALSTAFYPHTMSFGNLSSANQHSLPGAKANVGLNSIPQTFNGESSISSLSICDLHSPPRTSTKSAFLKSTLDPLEPITPEKTGKAGQGQWQESSMPYLSVDEMHTKKDTYDEVKELHLENKQYQLCATNSTQLPENHKPDKEGAEETDLSKTPSLKPRKKRHRPKVVVEGQSETITQPSTEYPLSSGLTKIKRKYVRRKGVGNLDNTLLEGGKTETDSNKYPPKKSTENTGFFLGTTKVKRKYVRRKGVENLNNTPTEGKSETDANKSHLHPNSNDTPIQKRKYVKKKAINKPKTTITDEGSTDAANRKKRTRTSCRRSLNFELESQEKDESFLNCLSSNQAIGSQEENFNPKDNLNATMQLRQGMEVTMEKTEKIDIGITYESTCFMNQVLKDYQSKPERHYSGPSTHTKMGQLQDDCTAAGGECHIVSSDVTHDKEENTVQVITNLDCQGTSKIPNNSYSSNRTCLNRERARTFKRQRMDTAGKAEICSKNATGIFYNSLQTYSVIFSQKTDKNNGTPSSHFPVFYNNMRSETGNSTATCSLQSTVMASGNEKLEMYPIKDTTAVEEQLNGNADSTVRDMGSPQAVNFGYVSSVNAVAEQLNPVYLHAESNKVSAQVRNVLATCSQEQNALVLYQRDGTVIPFDHSFDQVRKRRPRPKVELDDETIRVWQLLLENIKSEGIDGNDEEKSKWWEEERRVFKGRADSFIARMHLIQGDRRFSPWKGSVLDSVVGVFLTQNVSDHLSSSAFMSLAAHFPLKSKINPSELYDKRMDTNTKDPENYVLNPNEISNINGEVLNKEAQGGESKILQDFECGETDCIRSPGNNLDGIIPEDNFGGRQADISKHGAVTSHTFATNNKFSIIEDKRDAVGALSSQNSVTSSHSSIGSAIAQTSERTSLPRVTEEMTMAQVMPDRFTNATSSTQLIQKIENVSSSVYGEGTNSFDVGGHAQQDSFSLDLHKELQTDDCTSRAKSVDSCSESTSHPAPTTGAQASECFDLSKSQSKLFGANSSKGLSAAESIVSISSNSESQSSNQKFTSESFKVGPRLCSPNAPSSSNNQIETDRKVIESQKGQDAKEIPFREKNCNTEASNNPISPQILMYPTGSSSHTENSEKFKSLEGHVNKNHQDHHPSYKDNGSKKKAGRIEKEKLDSIDWDSLRKQAQSRGQTRGRTPNTMDSVDWEAVRCADVNEIAHTIRERGMNNRLAERIQDFLNRLVREHGSLHLEWLRDIPPDKAKEYLLSVRGLGLKSVECVRLLTLHHLAFPVDTNVGRVAVRLGWVPLQPLPESLQLHLLELYPIMESIQKYLWPRLCKLDQKTLYELHYQLITFGKVFCTKSKPNCNACPMRGECRHFASAFASARLALPASTEKSITVTTETKEANQNQVKNTYLLQLPSAQPNQIVAESEIRICQPIIEEPATPEPIIETPSTPEPSYKQNPEFDIESSSHEDPDEIPAIQLNMEEFTHNLRKIMRQNAEIVEVETSMALVALTSEAALIPLPKLKNVSQLRTEHQVYELPDSHPLLEGMDKREADDPCPYLLAIWTPGETENSVEPPEKRCSSQEFEKLCNDETCLSCNSTREADSLTVRGTLLIPCRTAMRGRFPLNGTYFQVNEVFSDHESSLCPINIPREWLWNLPRRTVYFGTSIPTIFKGLSTEGIQYCFWRGFVCVRGFDRKTRAPRPLIARLHFPASKVAKRKGRTGEN